MKSVLTTLGLVLGITGVAFAAGPAFEDVDANGDGMISKQEAKVVEGLNFDEADTNDDGSLSRAEYRAATSSGMEQ